MYNIVEWRIVSKIAEFAYTQRRDTNLQWTISTSLFFNEIGTGPTQNIQ